jgi:hypothetical protein
LASALSLWVRLSRSVSRTISPQADSVQRRVIDALLADGEAYDLIVDDDGAGEIADVVSLRVTEALCR